MNRNGGRRATAEHPLFYAMVAMGSSLAVGCGGVAKSSDASKPPGGASSSGSTDGTPASGASTGRGGAADPVSQSGSDGAGSGAREGSGAGGASGAAPDPSGAGGALVVVPVGAGGTRAGTGGSIDGGSVDSTPGASARCESAQWACASVPVCAAGDRSRVVVPDVCTCDLAKPTSPSECATGFTLVCRSGARASDAGMVGPPVPFDCMCVPTPSECGEGCKAAYGHDGADGYACDDAQANPILCGCAFVYLR